jgi:hypothetical protein
LLEAVAKLRGGNERVKQAKLLWSQGIGLRLRSVTGEADAESMTQARGCGANWSRRHGCLLVGTAKRTLSRAGDARRANEQATLGEPTG